MSEPEVSATAASPAAAAVAACALCQTPLAEGATTINGNLVCANCAAQVKAELAAEQQTGARLPLAIVAGAAGALLGAAVWAGVAIATNFAIGYIAVLVGFLAGTGVKMGAGQGRGQTLQAIAAGLAFFGLIAAKYFIFAHDAVRILGERGMDVGYLSPTVLGIFPEVIPEMLSPFDLLWVFLALGAAWRVPAASAVNVGS